MNKSEFDTLTTFITTLKNKDIDSSFQFSLEKEWNDCIEMILSKLNEMNNQNSKIIGKRTFLIGYDNEPISISLDVSKQHSLVYWLSEADIEEAIDDYLVDNYEDGKSPSEHLTPEQFHRIVAKTCNRINWWSPLKLVLEELKLR